jgi:O-antigen/teichoic acid export membrane protein
MDSGVACGSGILMRANSRFISIADQGVNSLSNFALVAFAAGASSASEFGRFSVAYAFLIFFLGAARALVGETALVHESATLGRQGALRREIVGASVPPAVLGAVLLAAISFFVPADARWVWLALGAGTLFAVVQDGYRYVALVEGRNVVALALDLVWTVPAVVAMGVLSALRVGAPWVVVAWSAGAILSIVCGAIVLRVLPNVVGGWRWVRSHASSSFRYLGEFASLNGSTLAVWVLLTPVVGAAGVGALRGAQLLFAPLNTIFTALRIAMIPELTRTTGSRRYTARLFELAGILLVGAAVWSIIVMLLGDGIGRALLGDTWAEAESLRVIFVVQYILMAAYTLVLTVFRVGKLNRFSTLMRVILAVLTLIAPLALAVWSGTSGAAWGFAMAVGGAVVVGAISLFRRRMRRTLEG